jgi:ferredoxin
MMKVKIDLDACIRAGECYYNPPELIKHAREAAIVCPASAIIVED